VGAGALGPVFRAFDPARDRLVAVKRFQLDVPPERIRELISRFERLIAANLSHPALAAPVATGLDGTAAYLAMEYATGESLDIAVRDYGAAPPADVLRVATQLAGALDFAAVVDVGHGAMHPRDVLLSGDETRLTGIGIARALESIGVAAPSRRPYAAPERLAGLEWDRRADIFSLAALIHELLWARRIAGTGSHAADALTDLTGANLPALRDAFARALADASSERFGTALEFAEALAAAFPNVGIAAAAAGPAAVKRPRRGSIEPPLVGSGNAPVSEEKPLAAEPPLREKPRLPLLDEPVPLPIAPPPPPSIHGAPTADLERALAAAPLNSGVSKERGLMADRVNPTEPGDLELRRAEAARYRDVESAPSVAPPRPAARPARVEPIADTVEMRPPEFMASALEQSRSAVWPLVLALVVGVAMGFAGGYGVGSRDRTAATTASAPSPAAVEPSGRESTDVAVAEGQKTAPVGSTGGEVRTPPAPAPATPDAPVEKPVAAAPKPEPVDGRLLVRSTPAGARVFVDGHEYGKTPVAVRELSPGSHRVRVVREGYGTEERRVVLTASRPAQSMTVPLERDRAQIAQARKPAVDPRADTSATVGRFSAPLTIESRPTGSHVYIDGKLVGATPLQLPDVTAGEHVVRLEHDGYHPWSSSVRIIATERNRVTASLEEIR